jgi:flagellar basal-body rod modification protein FlgD
MTTSPIGGASTASGSSSAGYNLTPSDFINMMVKQLQNQDPLNPTSNSELLAQMSQIGQLQASDSLQSSLQSMTLQTSLGAAGNLIGKSVTGLDANDTMVNGKVSSVQVQSGNVYLQLDGGQTLPMSNVTEISDPPATTAAATSTTAATAATTASGASNPAVANAASPSTNQYSAALAAAANAQTASLAAALGANAAAPAANAESLIGSLAAA